MTPAPCYSDFSFPTPSNTSEQNHLIPSNGRRRWTSTTKTKIKTEQGSIIADVDQSPVQNSNPPMPHSKSLFNKQQFDKVTSQRAVKSAGTPSEALPKSAWGDRVIELNASVMKATGTDAPAPFSTLKPENIDQSWMPSWFSNKNSNQDNVQAKPDNSLIDYDSDFEEYSDDDDDDAGAQKLLDRVCK